MALRGGGGEMRGGERERENFFGKKITTCEVERKRGRVCVFMFSVSSPFTSFFFYFCVFEDLNALLNELSSFFFFCFPPRSLFSPFHCFIFLQKKLFRVLWLFTPFKKTIQRKNKSQIKRRERERERERERVQIIKLCAKVEETQNKKKHRERETLFLYIF